MDIKKKFKLVLILIIIFTFAILSLFVYHKRPLYKTEEYIIKVKNEGSRYKPTLYKMLFRPKVLFLSLKSNNNRGYWFAINTKHKHVGYPIQIGKIPYLNYNSTMSLGVSIDDVIKINEGWKISWRNDEIFFSNDKISIAIKKQSTRQ